MIERLWTRRFLDANGYISLIVICVLIIVGIFILRQRNEEITQFNFITEQKELVFEDGRLRPVPVIREKYEETERGKQYIYYDSGVFGYNNQALTWSGEYYRQTNYEKPDAKFIQTKNFSVYIYNLKGASSDLNREVDINKIIKEENKSYNPVTILGFIEVEGEICYVVYTADNGGEDYIWVVLSLEDDKIVYIYEDREEYEKIEIFKDG